MKVDRYTKFVLTVIAVSLVIIAIRDVPTIASANAADLGAGVMPVNIVAIDGQGFGMLQIDSVTPAMPVKIEK